MDRDAAPNLFRFESMNPPKRPAGPGKPRPASSASDAARRRRIANRDRLRDCRVLVWDHPETRPLLARLSRLGCSVTASASVEDTIAKHGAEPFDLWIASPSPSDGDPIGVLRLLRRALPRVPLVLLSGEASVGLRIRCQALNPQYFATPPLADPELRAILQLIPPRPAEPHGP